MRRPIATRMLLLAALAASCLRLARADERITLTSGLELRCIHRELLADPGLVRLHTGPATWLDVPASSITLIEPTDAKAPEPTPQSTSVLPGITDIPTLLVNAGTLHHIDADLLNALVRAESAFRPKAVSRTGARGLMQLMPATAASLGVQDAFRPDQNIAGGTTYLDQLLNRFHNDIALALAAYNAGPAAVDRYHGVPPYRETRAYVARILKEYNRKKLALTATSPHP